MTWKDVLKGSCGTTKQQFEKGKACNCSECVKKAPKPDYIDIDRDGNKTEPMKEAAKDAKKRKE